MKTQRVITIGDVHGCLEELRELLAKVEFKPGDDRLILLDDLVDRGPNSVGVIQYARRIGAEAIMGNHDEKHVRYASWEARIKSGQHKGKNPVQLFSDRIAENKQLTDVDQAWLAALPATVRFKAASRDWVGVHAGFLPNEPIEKQKMSAVIRVAMLDRTTFKQLSLDDVKKPKYDPIDWTSVWPGPESVVFGHRVYGLDDKPYLHTPKEGVDCVGLDRGCCFGGHLVAGIWDGGDFPSFVAVKAHRAYASRRELLANGG